MHSIKNVLGYGLGLLALLVISGCSSMPQKIEVSAKPIDKPELVLPDPEVLRMKEVKWVLLTPENFEEKVAEIEATGRPVVFFALSDEGYENISNNFSSIRAYIQQQQAIIAAYENYYKNANEALDAANSNIESAAAEVEAQQSQEQESTLDKAIVCGFILVLQVHCLVQHFYSGSKTQEWQHGAYKSLIAH